MAEHALPLESDRPGISNAAIRALSRRMGESRSLTERRLWAARRYGAQELPDRVRQLWRYTDPGVFVPSADIGPAEPLISLSDPPQPPGGGSVLLHSGSLLRTWLSPEAQRAGVEVVPLSRGGPDLERLGSAVPAEHGVFEALNMAAWSAGVLIRVPAGATLHGPLHVVVPANASASLPRLLVHVGRGAAVDLIEEHQGGSTDSLVLGVSELFVEEGAQLRHVLIQGWADGVRGHLTHRTALRRDASALAVVGSLGGKLQKLDLGTVLEGEGAHSEIVGMALGRGRQHLDLHTEHLHRAGRTSSDMDIRVALAGRAQSVYTGLIRIEADAESCEAFQKNRNLLLSPRAKAQTIPELEILNSEVTCTHGATASPVDDDQLFYLQSRGIPPDEAAQLVVRGFFEPILDRIPAALRGEVSTVVERRISGVKGAVR